MSNENHENYEKYEKRGIAVQLCLLTLVSFVVYVLGGYNYFLSQDIKLIIKIVVPILLLGISVYLQKKTRSSDLTKVFFAFFLISLGFLMAWLFGRWYSLIPNYDGDTVQGWAIAKVAEVLPIIITVLFLSPFFGDKLEALYLRKGKIGVGLLMGLLICPVSLIQFAAQGGFGLSIEFGVILSWLPWMILFSFSNAFMEELIFRGLFLTKYEHLFGKKTALLFISTIFALFHVALLPFMGWLMTIVFVIFLFIVSWLWGLSIQKSKSLWGAVLAHAFADILLLIVVFGS